MKNHNTYMKLDEQATKGVDIVKRIIEQTKVAARKEAHTFGGFTEIDLNTVKEEVCQSEDVLSALDEVIEAVWGQVEDEVSEEKKQAWMDERELERTHRSLKGAEIAALKAEVG